MKVHPPEHPIFTWRQFLIHMSTVCLGLLIAIGLEQTVEALHHSHQRHELLEAIQQDNEKSLADLPAVELSLKAHLDWLNARLQQVKAARSQHGAISDLPLTHVTVRSRPVERAWDAAKTNNLVDVLSQDDIKAFSEVATILGAFDKSHDQDLEAIRRQRVAFEEQFKTDAPSSHADFTKATPQELARYIELLSEERDAVASSFAYAKYLQGALTSVAHGERNLERIDDSEVEAAGK